jgi:hypothetical protein
MFFNVLVCNLQLFWGIIPFNLYAYIQLKMHNMFIALTMLKFAIDYNSYQQNHFSE